jgi:CHAT domain-containing protein
MYRKLYCCLMTLLLVLIFGQVVQAQSWAALKAKADSIANTLAVNPSYAAYKQVLKQAENEFGKTHLHYADALHHVGIMLIAKGQNKPAEDTLLLAQHLLKQIGPAADTLLGLNLEQLAVCYRRQNQFTKAEPTYLMVLAHWEKLLGRNSARYAYMQTGLANLFAAQNQPAKALPLMLAALTYQKGHSGLNDIEYSTLLNSTASVYGQLDQPDKAEALLLESLAVRQKSNSPEIVYSHNSLAVLYERMGEFEKSLNYYTKAVKGIAVYKPGSVEHATILQNMAICLGNMGRQTTADSLYEQTLTIYRQLNYTKTISYATTLVNQALLRNAQGRFQEASALNAEASTLTLALNGRRSVLYARLLFNEGSCRLALADYTGADSLLTHTLALNDSLVGTVSLDYAQATLAKSTVWYKTGQTDRAINGFDKGLAVYKQRVLRQFLYTSSSQKDAFMARWNAAAPLYYTISGQQTPNLHLASESYTLALFLKNLLLNEQQQLFSTIRQSGDALLLSRLDSVQQLSKLLTQQYSLPPAKRANLDSLEAKAEALEKTLAQQSAPFRNAQQAIRATWQDVQEALKPGEAAVEFIHFQYHNGYKLTDSTRYMALVLRPGWAAPRLVPLMHEKQLAALLTQPPLALATTLKPLRARQQVLTNTGQLAQGRALYKLIWQPIDSLLGGAKQVWVAPSGLLHKVALAALPYPGNVPATTLADRYTLRQVATTRARLTAAPTRLGANARVRLYGGIAYATDSLGRAEWDTLPGTLREVQAIGQLLGTSATVVTGVAATRQHLLNQPAANVLHLATHSFFRSPDSTRTDFVRARAERTLRRSGIVLAGANRPTPTETGILSGQELANLDLVGTDLVVLSGCETGLGDIRGSEGVFGLQRAVKMAGARNLLMSLWPVPDGPTSQFMTAFYRNWKRPNVTLHGAFAQTQRQFRSQYPPAVWAAFVLIE